MNDQNQNRMIALDLAIKANPGKPIELLIDDAKIILEWILPAATVAPLTGSAHDSRT